jgi:hypothetical protein
MKIGIFSEQHNSQASRLHHHINSLIPNSCQLFTLPKDNGTPKVTLDETGIYWDNINVTKLDIAYLHGFSYTYPVIPASPNNTDWNLWQFDYLLEQQKFSFLLSAFTEMERHGVKLFNSPKIHLKNFAKQELLEDLRHTKFLVPRIICTNDIEATQTFIQDIGTQKIVWRPATGRAAWQLFRDKQREFLIAAEKTPVLLAEIIEGPLIRSFLVNGRSLLDLNRHSPACILHAETLESFQVVNSSEFHEELQKLVNHLSLPWGQISFILREGRPWIYDIDPDPILGQLPDLFHKRLIGGLARGILGLETGVFQEPLPESPQTRPTLFLKRMLFPLFELEAMKYNNPP